MVVRFQILKAVTMKRLLRCNAVYFGPLAFVALLLSTLFHPEDGDSIFL
jgi:hypothetical protein